jgi:MFS family permease
MERFFKLKENFTGMNSIQRSSLRVMLCGTSILALAIGIRLSFGLFLQPMSQTLGWGRETFAFAIALQNIVWGLTQPLMGMLADKYGTRKVVALGGLGYSLGLYLMSQANSPLTLNLTAGLLIGVSLSATSFAVVLGAVGRAVSERNRSMALGLASAGGSVGQALILPIGQALIAAYGWVLALGGLVAIALIMVPLAAALGPGGQKSPKEVPGQLMSHALVEAGLHRGYWLLTAGFLVCGFHVTFMATHLPAYIVDSGLSPGLGATALALIGLFNILGSFFWGVMGGRHSKKYSLSSLYLARAVLITALLVFPVSKVSILVFASGMGFLWLGTVPLTSGLIGQIFGVRYLSTLFGIVFFSHQIGAFLGVWMGGYVFDVTGSYDIVWYLSVVLGVLSALLHWPINEQPVARLALADR